MNYGVLKRFAKENRQKQTYAERLLWYEISHNRYDFKFRRQHIVDNFIADFICLRYNLIIEVDGGYHAQYGQQKEDKIRTDILEEMGYAVIRFTNDEVALSPSNVAERIYKRIFQLAGDE